MRSRNSPGFVLITMASTGPTATATPAGPQGPRGPQLGRISPKPPGVVPPRRRRAAARSDDGAVWRRLASTLSRPIGPAQRACRPRAAGAGRDRGFPRSTTLLRNREPRSAAQRGAPASSGEPMKTIRAGICGINQAGESTASGTASRRQGHGEKTQSNRGGYHTTTYQR